LARRAAKPSPAPAGIFGEPFEGSSFVDCFFHHAVPSVARCTGCGKSVCATCRAETGDCPSCRLAARVDAAAAQHQQLHGGVGPSSPGPQPGWSTGPQPGWSPQPQPQPQPQRAPAGAALANVRPESRALVALGYPFWPLALIALFDQSGSEFVRRNAWQALGFNAGIYAVGWLFSTIATIPFIGFSAWPLLPFIVPVAIVASVVYGIKAWHGEDVRVPFVSDMVDKRLHPGGQRASGASTSAR
jgi:uncharacterized membrane protein